MAKGIQRKIDELGSITIPKEIRKAMGIKEKDRLGMCFDKDIIQLFVVGSDFVGYSRCLDDLGRWTVPIEIRRTLNCSERQWMDIYVDDSEVFEDTKMICIQKVGCSWCESSSDLIEVNGHVLCEKCAIEVAKEVYRRKKATA